jgi:outer membrane protein, heavy metal efflux system
MLAERPFLVIPPAYGLPAPLVRWTGGLVTAGLLAGCARYQPAPVSATDSAATLETRSLADAGLKDFVTRHSAPPPAQWPLRSWDLQALTLAAFYFHPSLDVARAQWGVAQAAVKTAGGRPNPVVSAVPGYTMNPAAGVSPWIPLVSLDIPITTAGKRGHRVAQAQNLAEAARLSIASAAWQVRSNLRTALLDYAAARQRAALLQRQLELQQQIVGLLEQRLQAGAVARQELTLPRLALARTGVELADAQRQAAEARVRVAAALGLPAQGIAGAEFEFPIAPSAEGAPELTTAAARQQALRGRPDILSALAEYAASESALQLELAKQYPDIHLNPGYQFDQGEHKWSVGLSVELPVLNQNQGPIAEARARRQESAARFLALQARVIADIDRALAVRASALEQVERQGRLTQLAREQSAAAEVLFQAGAADKLELTSAQLEAGASDLARLEAQIKAEQALAQLEDALQRPLEGWPGLEQGRPALSNPGTP